MCLIIVKPANKVITRRKLKNGFWHNSDGAGYMYAENDVLKVRKGFFTFRDFYKAFRKSEQEHKNADFAIHFRFATHGYTTTDMCHPFLVDDVGLMHNGILSEYCYKNATKSDTALFCEKKISKLPKNWIYNSAIITFLEAYAREEFSKFVVMNAEGKYKIINESAGHWDDGCWFSSSDKEKKVIYYEKYNTTATSENFNRKYDYEFENETPELMACEGCGYKTDENDLEVVDDLLLCEACRETFYPYWKQQQRIKAEALKEFI